MKQIAFILHGKIKKQDRIIAAVKTIFGETAALFFHVTQHAQHANQLVYDSVKQGATHIICLGGDGSLNEVINGVMRAKADGYGGHGESEVQVGLLPHGTGNDLAKTMRCTNDIGLLKTWIATNSYRYIDLGLAEFSDPQGNKASRYFVNITDVGIGGVIAHHLASSSKFWGPTITYQKEILSALLTYKNQPVKVRGDNFDYDGKAMSIIVANGQFFGGGMGIAPHAVIDDRLLSVVIIGEISMFDYLKNLGNIKKSKRLEHPHVQYLTSVEVSVESPEGPLPIDMDGEFVGYSPMHLKNVPAAIRFIAPK